MTSRRTIVWVNRSAGGGHGGRSLERVLGALEAHGDAIVLVDAPDAVTARSSAKAALAQGADLVVAIGGDGTVHHALQLVAATSVQLAVIPAGSGDDIARTIGVTRGDTAAAIDTLLHGRVRTFDLGRATSPHDEPGAGKWFGATLYAGFDARVNARANRMKTRMGPAKYPLAVIAEIAALRAHPFTIERDGAVERTTACAVIVGNGNSYGGGMLICPDARADDGWLDLTLVEGVPRRTLLRVLPKVYSGRHIHHPAVHTSRARSVRLAAPELVAFADGEEVGPLPLTIEVVPEALHVLVP